VTFSQQCTHTHTQYIIAFPLQQWLCECTRMLHCMYIACLVTSLDTILDFFLYLSNVLSVIQDCSPKRPLQAPVHCIFKISLVVIYFSLLSVWGKNFSCVMFLVSYVCYIYILIYFICNLILQCMCARNLYVYRSCFFLIV